MSRYIANYTTIKNKIDAIDQTLGKIDIQKIPNENIKIEYLRFRKNFSLMKDIIENIEPEFISGNISSFNQQSQNLINSLNDFASNPSQNSYIVEANNYLDSISNFLRPYILHRKRLKNSLAKAIEDYIETIENHLSDLAEFQAKLEEAQQYTSEIEDFHRKLLSEEDGSLKTKIFNIFEEIKQKKSEIYNFYDELFVDDEEESIRTSIHEAKSEIEKTKDEAKEVKLDIDEIYANSSKSLKELKEFYIEVFGELDEETEERLGGLKKEIDKKLKQIENLEELHNKLLEDQKEKYKALEDQINSLLPGATSVGLAKTYSENREKFEQQTKFWSRMFIGTMVAIFGFGIYIVYNKIQLEPNHIFEYSPIYISIIWLAIFALRRRNESMRLEQEYTHKETLAKSYISYKEQIENLSGDDKDELLRKMLESTSATISQNPNHVLDKQTENHPAIELFGKIWGSSKK